MTTTTPQPDDRGPMTSEAFRAQFLKPGRGEGGDVQPLPVADLARINAGRAAQQGGEAFERELQALHAVYRFGQLALIDRLPVPTAPAPRKYLNPMIKKLPPVLIRSARQLSDFSGVVGKRIGAMVPHAHKYLIGRAIYMEAKACGEARKSLPIVGEGRDGFGLKAHQLYGLAERTERAKALSAVVWRNGSQTLVLTPGEVMRFAKGHQNRTEKSIPVAAFVPAPREEGWLQPVVVWGLVEEVGKS